MAHVHSAAAKNIRALQVTFAVTFGYFLVELAGGLLTNSLALLADAGHMLTDAGGLGLALFASGMSRKPPTASKTYGYYRLEILAAAVNAVVLFLVSIYILIEAWRRFRDPEEVAGAPMLLIAAVGLLVNLIGAWMLHEGAGESLNVRGAFLEVVSDVLGSAAVIVAGVIVWTTGWLYADPLFSVVIGLFIIPRTWHLLSQAVHILLEGVPAHIDLAAVRSAMLEEKAVADVHDLHVWTITSGREVATAHVVLAAGVGADSGPELAASLSAELKARFGIGHSTIQVERPGRCETAEECEH